MLWNHSLSGNEPIVQVELVKAIFHWLSLICETSQNRFQLASDWDGTTRNYSERRSPWTTVCSYLSTISSKPWSSQFWTQFKQMRTEALKSQDFNGVWTHDLAITVRRSNQLSYEATDVGSWSFVSSNEPVKNECEVIYDMFHIFKLFFCLHVN